MGLKQGIFAVKLCELEREYGRLQSRIHLFEGKDAAQAQQEILRLQDEYREHKLLLDERIRSSRSSAVSSLSKAQLEYGQRVEQILNEELPNEMRGRNQSCAEDQAEVMTLYAEYAIDFATQSMRQALAAALSAVVLQQRAEQEAKKYAEKENRHE